MWERYWPDLSDLESAREASRQGMWAALALAGMTAFAMLAESPTVKSFVDPRLVVPQMLLFLAIAYGIYRFSKPAAIAGLACFVVCQLYALTKFVAQSGDRRFTVLAITLLIVAFINGVRGTFAYHRLLKANSGVASPRLLSDRL